MASLSESRLGTVRSLIRSAPDTAIRDLEAALSSGAQSHENMRLVQQMVVAEAIDRRSRGAVFAPLVRLCPARGGSAYGPSFPLAVLVQLWNGLKEEAPREIAVIVAAISDPDFGAPSPAKLDALCVRAAAGLRARSNPGYLAAAEALERVEGLSVDLFCGYLDLAPLARSALERLPEWVGRLNEERAAAARLAFRDAAEVAEDAGPRLMEILYAHLSEPWLVLRLISAVMHRPADRYLATSEMASFGERLMNDLDARLAAITTFDAEQGSGAGSAVGAAVRTSAIEVQEFEESIELSPQGPWGSRLIRLRRALALAIEGRLKMVESEVGAALPVQRPARSRSTRGHPQLGEDPDPRLVTRARAYLMLMNQSKAAADRLGFGALWNKVAEGVHGRLDTYVEDLLEKLRNVEECEDPDRVRHYLDIAAEFLGLVSDDKTAQIVRRRVAAAA